MLEGWSMAGFQLMDAKRAQIVSYISPLSFADRNNPCVLLLWSQKVMSFRTEFAKVEEREQGDKCHSG